MFSPCPASFRIRAKMMVGDDDLSMNTSEFLFYQIYHETSMVRGCAYPAHGAVNDPKKI